MTIIDRIQEYHAMSALPVIKIDATRAKHRFGELLRHAGRREVVALSKRGRDVAYLISPEMFASLQQLQRVEASPLAEMEAEFDRMVTRMQERPTRNAIDQLLDADDAAINAVARKALRGRKK
jgi:prevent-host-death family protein